MPARKKISKEISAAIDQLEIRRKENYEKFHPSKEGAAWEYCLYMNYDFFKPREEILKIIADNLQDAFTGKIDKLMINIAPRTGKSYTTSTICSWAIGYFPEASIIGTSYSEDLSTTFSKAVKGMIKSNKFKMIFGDVDLSKNYNMASDWSVNEKDRATYIAVGANGTITGRGFSLAGIIDDPIKNDKVCTRKFLDDMLVWYANTFDTRREINPYTGKKAPTIIIATRWHTDDLCGKLARLEAGDWKIIKFKAAIPDVLSPNMRSFCENIYTTEELKKKINLAQAGGILNHFKSVYQQEPINEVGVLFPEDSLKYISEADIDGIESISTLIHIDTADEGADFLSMPIVKQYNINNKNTYIMSDCVFSSEELSRLLPKIVAKIAINKPNIVTVETNKGGKFFVDILSKEISKLNLGYNIPIIGINQSSNKETRILTASPEIKANIVFINPKEVKDNPEYRMFMNNLCSYVKGGKNEHDDAPDSLAGIMELVRSNTIGMTRFEY